MQWPEGWKRYPRADQLPAPHYRYLAPPAKTRLGQFALGCWIWARSQKFLGRLCPKLYSPVIREFRRAYIQSLKIQKYGAPATKVEWQCWKRLHAIHMIARREALKPLEKRRPMDKWEFRTTQHTANVLYNIPGRSELEWNPRIKMFLTHKPWDNGERDTFCRLYERVAQSEGLDGYEPRTIEVPQLPVEFL